MRTNFDIVFGALIDLQRMKIPLDPIDLGNNGKSLIFPKDGEVLTHEAKADSDVLTF